MAGTHPQLDLRAYTERRTPESRALPVCIVAGDAALRGRAIAALDGGKFSVQITHDPAQPSPEIIVTDQTLAASDLAPFHDRLARGELGMIVIGKALPADVQLPADFTRRELRLACRMLAQIVTLRRKQRKFAQLAATDPLTGLANRRALEEHVSGLWEASEAPLALAIIDLDQFKRINAQQGYVRGDDVLAAAGKALFARRRDGFAARLGGDEFALVWRENSADDALAIAEEVRHVIGHAASLKAERHVAASAGVAIVEEGGFTALLAAADGALRAAKESGGKRTELAEHRRV